MAVVPPPVIEQRLSALVPRLRALRVAKGACQVVAVALGIIGVVLFLDAAFGLPAWSRGLFLSVWLTSCGVLAWRWILLPWRADISLVEVARELEKRLPELGERLRLAVVRTKAESPNAIRAAVDEDTARRAKTVDLAAALPVKSVAVFTVVAVLPLAVAVILAALVPSSGDRLRRVALPWSRNTSAAFSVHTSGDLVVKRGGPVTLSAYPERNGSSTAMPQSAFLFLRTHPDAQETRVLMTTDGVTFRFTRPNVPGDFEYCVELEGAPRSEWFHVTAIDAVELTEGTRIEITPPAYSQQPKTTLPIFAALNTLQFSSIDFDLKFNRPATSAHFDWRPEGAQKSEFIPLPLAENHLSVKTNLRIQQSGVLKLVLVNQANGKTLATELPAAVHAQPDTPPRFEQLAGVTSRPRVARSNDHIHIDFIASDDFAVSGATLEYSINSLESSINVVSIPLTVQKPATRVRGYFDFNLAGLANEGQILRFRIRVSDNRNLDDPKLSQQEAVYPPTGWSELRLKATAPPLEQQNIVCQRDTLRDGLTVAKQRVSESATEIRSLHTDTTGQTSLAFDHVVRLNNLWEKVHTAQSTLHDLARDAALTPELRSLAANARKLADEPLTRASELLRQAETHDPTIRKTAFDNAVAQLDQANSELSELLLRNTAFAQNRLDRMKLTTLVAAQTALADTSKAPNNERIAKQNELLSQLETMIAESDPLRTAVETAKNNEMQQLAKRVRELADTLRELNAATKQTASETRAALAATIARDQAALTKRTTAIFATLETPARLAGLTLPRPEDFLRVAELAAAGKTVEALAELEKHSQALEHIATIFEKWSVERIDPKFAAKQLALWQDDLLSRFRAKTKNTVFILLPADVQTDFRTEQKALTDAANALSLPSSGAVKSAHENVMIHTNKASELLAGNAAGVEIAMKSAVAALNLLAENTPSISKRLSITLHELDPLRQELDTTNNAIELALRNYDRPLDSTTIAAIAKKLAPYAERQQKLIAGVAALDLPGMAARQTRIIAALKTTLRDMRDGSPLDVQVSQAVVRREFERLKFVLEGNPSPDVKTAELHRRLILLADSLDASKSNPKQLELTKLDILDVQEQLAKVIAPEAPLLLNDARVAVQIAEAAPRDAKPEEVRRLIRNAAEALGKLSERLNGTERELDRVHRLSLLRHHATEKPKELLFSDDAMRQLTREMDELSHTRVGAAGQFLKKRAIDLYTKIREMRNPDRLGTDLKALTTVMDELAAKMSDIAELATINPHVPEPVTSPEADKFLPSKMLASSIRTLAKEQRILHVQVTAFTTELTRRRRPTARDTIASLEKQQRALANDVVAFAKQVPDAQVAATRMQITANDLHVTHLRAAKENSEAAVKLLRQLALAGVGKPWSKQAVDFFARQDAILRDLTGKLTSPAAAVAEQMARTEEAARNAGELATLMELAEQSSNLTELASETLDYAAKNTHDADTQLMEAAALAAEGKLEEARKLSAASEKLLRETSEKLAAVAPAGPSSETGEALRSAERAMRKAKNELASETNLAAAEKAMRDAVQFLREAEMNLAK